MAKKKKKKRAARKKAARKGKRTTISVQAVKDAIRDAEQALNIAERNLKSLKRKFGAIPLKQSKCRIVI